MHLCQFANIEESVCPVLFVSKSGVARGGKILFLRFVFNGRWLGPDLLWPNCGLTTERPLLDCARLVEVFSRIVHGS